MWRRRECFVECRLVTDDSPSKLGTKQMHGMSLFRKCLLLEDANEMDRYRIKKGGIRKLFSLSWILLHF